MASAAVLGTVVAIGSSGILMGSIAMSIWGGPKSRIKGVVGFNLMQALALIVSGFYLNIACVTAAIFLVFASFPIINNCSQAIWQTKVAPELQGRVFATRRMISMIFVPIAYLGAGPLADHVFEPLMDVNGPLASSVGRIIGVGPNKGIGLLFILLGIAMALEVVAGYCYPRLRKVEEELPDAAPSEPPDQAEQIEAETLISQPIFESEAIALPIEATEPSLDA
jgi:hypothetical protein